MNHWFTNTSHFLCFSASPSCREDGPCFDIFLGLWPQVPELVVGTLAAPEAAPKAAPATAPEAASCPEALEPPEWEDHFLVMSFLMTTNKTQNWPCNLARTIWRIKLISLSVKSVITLLIAWMKQWVWTRRSSAEEAGCSFRTGLGSWLITWNLDPLLDSWLQLRLVAVTVNEEKAELVPDLLWILQVFNLNVVFGRSTLPRPVLFWANKMGSSQPIKMVSTAGTSTLTFSCQSFGDIPSGVLVRPSIMKPDWRWMFSWKSMSS